jgi:catechol 2,3-dioxygenase-like lactoylglutathione lyase family enzyme
MYKVSDVHHIAIGVRDIKAMKSFYRDVLKFTDIFGEFPGVEHAPMREVIRGPRVVFSGIMLKQESGNIFVELIEMIEPAPRPIRSDFHYGDIGVSKITIATPDIEKIYRELKNKVNFCSEPKQIKMPGFGDYRFVYLRDPEGNLIELAEMNSGKARGNFGGVVRVGISVTDLKRSISFYQKHMAFHHVVVDIHDSFSGFVDEVAGGNRTKVRSCILAHEKDGGTLELFEMMEPRGRSIPFSTRWGDLGYLQVCVFCNDIPAVAAHCEKEGIEVLCSPQDMDTDKPEEAGTFMYIKDPDGIPLEFLNIHHQL